MRCAYCTLHRIRRGTDFAPSPAPASRFEHFRAFRVFRGAFALSHIPFRGFRGSCYRKNTPRKARNTRKEITIERNKLPAPYHGAEVVRCCFHPLHFRGFRGFRGSYKSFRTSPGAMRCAYCALHDFPCFPRFPWRFSKMPGRKAVATAAPVRYRRPWRGRRSAAASPRPAGGWPFPRRCSRSAGRSRRRSASAPAGRPGRR